MKWNEIKYDRWWLMKIMNMLLQNTFMFVCFYLYFYLIYESWWQWNHLNVNSANVAENTKHLRQIHNLFITNKLSLQRETLSNCDSFTVNTVLHNNDVLTCDYKNNNKYQVTMS